MVPSKANPVSLPRLPVWLTSLPADHPDVGPTRPPYMPTAPEIRRLIATCDAILDGQATPAFAKQCLAKLLVAFEPNTKLSADDIRLRAMVWLEACGDLNDALWAEATTEAIKGFKWMPKPSEFRELVEPRRTEAMRGKEKLQGMLGLLANPKPAFKAEPLDVRLRAMRDSFRKVGDIGKAAGYERAVAFHEKREPEEWAKNVAEQVTKETQERPPFKPDMSPSALRCAELARQRRLGVTAADEDPKDRAQSAGTP